MQGFLSLSVVLIMTVLLSSSTSPAKSERQEVYASSVLEPARDSVLQAFKQHLQARELTMLKVPLLQRSEKLALRTSRNDCHVEKAQELGIARGTSFGEGQLLCLDGNSMYYVEYDCHAKLTKDALVSLDALGRIFHRALAEVNLPPVRFAISSAYRSPEYQKRLARMNRNATRNISSHEYGTTYDITYRRFFQPAEDSFDPNAFEVSERLAMAFPCLRDELRVAEQVWANQMTERYASRFAAVLGRSLIQLEGDGLLLVLREWRQPCFHITVAKPLGGA